MPLSQNCLRKAANLKFIGLYPDYIAVTLVSMLPRVALEYGHAR